MSTDMSRVNLEEGLGLNNMEVQVVESFVSEDRSVLDIDWNPQ